MTDRVHSFTVVLSQNIREDDAGLLLSALRQFRGVIDVRPNVVDIESTIAASRARHAAVECMREAISALLTRELS